MRIGKAHPAEIGHGVVLDPDDIVQDPEIQILQDGPHPVNIVVRADDPDGAGILEHPPAGLQPGAGEGVVLGEAGEAVPLVVDGVYQAVVRTPQLALQL
jgi:hypothetical protein